MENTTVAGAWFKCSVMVEELVEGNKPVNVCVLFFKFFTKLGSY